MNSLTLPTRANADVIDAAYSAWLQNPNSVDPTWHAFFQGFTLGTSGAGSAPRENLTQTRSIRLSPSRCARCSRAAARAPGAICK